MAFLNASVLIYIPLLLAIPVSYSEARRQINFQEKGNYCGPRLTEQLHNFCEFFYGPSDLGPEDRLNRRLVAEECCDAPCSILHIVLSYCKKPKYDAIRKTFGREEFEYYKSLRRNMTNSTLEALKTNSTTKLMDLPVPESIEKTVRRKKHIRTRRRRRKRKCGCPKDEMEIEKRKMLMNRLVPEYTIGVSDYQENEPMIINSL